MSVVAFIAALIPLELFSDWFERWAARRSVSQPVGSMIEPRGVFTRVCVSDLCFTVNGLEWIEQYRYWVVRLPAYDWREDFRCRRWCWHRAELVWRPRGVEMSGWTLHWIPEQGDDE